MHCFGVAAGVGAVLVAGGAAAQQPLIDEIVVTTTHRQADPTELAPDAEALIATPGDLNDPIRALFNLPGLTFSGSDLDGPTIRGASPEQNLYLVDGIPLPDLFHSLSDSIISSDVVHTLSMESAAFAPSYGGALGGVIDVTLRRPGSDFGGRLHASQLKAGGLIEGSISESLTGYLSFRNNLAHLFLDEFERNQGPLVYQMPESRDYVGRLSKLTDRFELSATLLGAWDRTEDVPRDELANGVLGERQTRTFDAQAIRLQSRRGTELQADITLSHSNLEDDRRERRGGFEVFSVEQWSMRGSLSGTHGAHNWTIGANVEQSDADLALLGQSRFCDDYNVICGTALAQSTNPGSPAFSGSFFSSEVFLSDTVTLGEEWTAEVGLHVVHDAFLSETLIEPRARLSRVISDNWDVYASAGFYSARPELQSLIFLGESQEYTRSVQVLAGQRIDLSSGFRIQTELWFKSFEGDVFLNTTGSRSYDAETVGLDLIVGRPWGERLTGWLAISLSDGEVRSTSLQINAITPPDPAFDFENPYAIPTARRSR
jgi:hypothetical protein